MNRSKANIAAFLASIAAFAAIIPVAAGQSIEPVAKASDVTPEKLRSLADIVANASGERRALLVFRLASLYYVNRDFENSNRLFRDLISKNETPASLKVQSRLLLGQGLSGQKKYSEAIAVLEPFTKDLAKDPKAPIALAQMVNYGEAGQTGEGISLVLQRCYKEEPTFELTALFRQIVPKIQAINTGKAVKACEDWLKAHPKSAYASLIAMDRYRLELDGANEQSAQLTSILSKYPSDSCASLHVRYENCIALIREKKYKEAGIEGQRYIEIDKACSKDKFYDAEMLLTLKKILIFNEYEQDDLIAQALVDAKAFIKEHPGSRQAKELEDWIKLNKMEKDPDVSITTVAIIGVVGLLAVAGAIFAQRREKGK